MVFQAMSLLGAFMVLGAYFSLQRGTLARDDRLFSLLNVVGAGMLTVVAVEDRQLGFIVLEGRGRCCRFRGFVRGREEGTA